MDKDSHMLNLVVYNFYFVILILVLCYSICLCRLLCGNLAVGDDSLAGQPMMWRIWPPL